MIYGLTSNGFVIKPYSVIQQELQAGMQGVFGTDLDVSDQSIAGQWINEMALKYVELWELCQALYASYNPDTASGAALDDACSRVNITRLQATPSKVMAMLYGSVGTTIPMGNLISQAITGYQAALDASITLDGTIAGDVIIKVDSVQNNYLYSITINGTPHTYLSDGSATDVEIIDGLYSALGTIAGLTITKPTTTTLEILTSDGSTAFSCVLDIKLKFDLLGCPSLYTMVLFGAKAIPLETMTTIVNAVSGFNSVTNLIQGTIGRTLETDDALRIRRRTGVKAIGKATDGAIAFNLLQYVNGVTSAFVISNRTDAVDSGGRPAHSFEAIVAGGLDAEVAEEIWQVMPAGIETFGNTSYVITDTQGQNHTINFSRPTNLYIWVNIVLTKYSEEIYPTDGDSAMKTAIYNWSLGEFAPGKDVILQRILSPVYSIPGVSNAVITLATSATPGGPPGPYSAANITVGSAQLAVFDATRISIS